MPGVLRLSHFGLITALAFAASSLAPPATGMTTSEIYAQVDTLRTAAAGITIDGDLSDWATFPFWNDPSGDAGGDASRDVVAVSLAPLDQELLVSAETAAAPASGAAFSVLIDLQGDLFPDLLLVLDSAAPAQTLLVLDQDNNVIASGGVTGIELALAPNGFELRIPYTSLTPVLPAAYATALQSANHRSWVRLRVDSHAAPFVTLDASRSAGSYRLITTPYPLDPPLQTTGIDNPTVAPIEMDFPMDGRWLVAQGPDGFTTHAGFWMYDWVTMDADFNTSDPPMSSNNNDYYSFGQQAYAPLAGTVTSAIGIHPDNVPGLRGPVNNEVLIDDGTGWLTRLFHFAQSSVTVSTSQLVAAGDPVGLVGNSGNSGEAHMHLDTFGIGGLSGSRRIAHPYVEVTLVPGTDTHWRRHVTSWEPRVGMFAEVPEPGLMPALFSGLTLLATASRRRTRLSPRDGRKI